MLKKIYIYIRHTHTVLLLFYRSVWEFTREHCVLSRMFHSDVPLLNQSKPECVTMIYID